MFFSEKEPSELRKIKENVLRLSGSAKKIATSVVKFGAIPTSKGGRNQNAKDKEEENVSIWTLLL